MTWSVATRDMCRTGGDHSQHRADDAANRGDFAAVLIASRGQRIKIAKQFVGAVDQINFQDSLQGKGISIRAQGSGLKAQELDW